MTIIVLSKAFVKEHQRRKKDGSVYMVLAHYDKRVKKNTEHAPEHGHDISHLNDDDKVRFNQMHAEQHLAKHYDEHAIKQQLQDSKSEHDKLILEADVQDKLGDHKAATKLRNKAIKINQRMMRFQRQLSKLEETISGIGKMKDQLVAGSGGLIHDAAAHAHYVSKLGAKFKGRAIFIKKVTKPKQAFVPTHTLSDGVPARHVEGNIYIDKDGDEIEDYYAEPVAWSIDNIDSDNIGANIEDRKACKLKVLEKLKPIFQDSPKVVSSHNGDKIIVAWSGIKHAMNAGLPTWQEAAAALHIESLIAKSKAVEVKPDKLGRDDPKSTTIYQTDVKFDGVPHKVSIFVRNHSDGNRYYDHVTIETKNSAGLTGSLAPTLPFAESQEGDKVASDKSITTSHENAIENDSPKEGERNADGLVFRNGRWHREGDDADKSARFHADIKALKETNFKYKAGDKVIDEESGKKYMVLSSYIQDGQVRYTVYPPGKKSSVGYHIWVKESDLVNSGNDEANKPAKVVSIKEVARKPDAAQSAIKENIQDLGEKIGGARKDTATKTGSTGAKKEANNSPAWARRFSISQVVVTGEINQSDVGKWIVRDNKQKNWAGHSRQMAKFDTEKQAQDALPLIAVALKHTVTTGYKDENGDATYEIWRKINDKKRVKVIDKSFKSREEAMQYMAQHAQEILEANTTFGESDLPVPENKQRAGKVHRNSDVTGESFMTTFGMRGVEFGNWNNQDERQEVMNAAYDGLMDLSEVLGIPPKAIGLNGELALAFGARGAGLSSAKAHYERAKSVINLTKMNGAGSLAHEWLHALDHYLGRQDGKADANWVVGDDGTRHFKVKDAEADYVSSGFRYSRSGVREELRDAFKSVMETISHKAETYIEDTKRADNFVAGAKEGLAESLDGLRKELSEQKDPKYYKRNNKPASAEQLMEFDTIASQLLNGEDLETRFKYNEKQTRRGGMAGHNTNEQLDKISAIYKAVRGRSGFDATNNHGVLDRMRQNMSHYNVRLKQLASANSSEEKIKEVPTSFAMDARELDQGRGGNYWTSPHEMAARAFQGYVEDKMAEKEGKNPFLNHAPENAALVTPWGLKRVYPHGQERKAINAAFDKFVSALKTKETDQGTALYSKASVLPDAAKPKGITESQANAAIESFKRDFGNVDGVEFKVYANNEEAFKDGGSIKGRVKGFYKPKSRIIGIIRSSVDSMQDATETLRHETLCHFGLNLLKPTDKLAFLGSIAKSKDNILLRKMFADVARDYPEMGNDEFKQAEEVFARVAEEKPSALTEWLDKQTLKLLGLFRNSGRLKGVVTKADMRAMVKSLAEGVRRGDKQQTFPKDNQSQFNKSSVASGYKALPPHTMILLNIRARRVAA